MAPLNIVLFLSLLTNVFSRAFLPEGILRPVADGEDIVISESHSTSQHQVQQPFTLVGTSSPLPVVIWHGLGDSFENTGLQDVASLMNETNPGTTVHIIRLGSTGSSDRSATFFGNLTEQTASVCDQLASHPVLRDSPAINAIGFSQGGQFLRGYIERCNNPPVYNLVTFGSQHNGISEFQSCRNPTDWTCQSANALLRSGTWSDFVQNRLVPAQYFRDPEELERYLEHSNFLADINNERELKNTTYANNLKTLNKFVMYLFEDDITVVPKESGWFAEVNRTSQEITPLRERDLYKEDWLGLKELDQRGGLVFDTVEGEHMQLRNKDLRMIFKKYFAAVLESDLAKWKNAFPSSTSYQSEL